MESTQDEEKRENWCIKNMLAATCRCALYGWIKWITDSFWTMLLFVC